MPVKPLQTFAVFSVILFLALLLPGIDSMPNAQPAKSRQTSIQKGAKTPAAQTLPPARSRGGPARTPNQRAPAKAQARPQVSMQRRKPDQDENLVAEEFAGTRRRELESKIGAVEDHVIQDPSPPADKMTRDEAAEHNAVSWGTTLMFPNLHPPCRFPDMTPFATTVAQSRWDLVVPFITTGDGLYDIWTLRLIPSMAAPLSSASSASGMAGIGSAIPWTQPSGSQYAPSNYTALQANFGWYRCTAACLEIKNIGPVIAQQGIAYAGCFPPGATSATISQLASTTFCTSISNTDTNAPYIISWIPVSETPIDTAVSGSSTLSDVGLTYRPLTNPNVLDSNVIFVMYTPHASSQGVSLECTVTMDWELIPLTQTLDMFKPKAVIASQEATTAVLAAVSSDSNKPPGTQNTEDSPGFLGALAATAGAAISTLKDGAIDFIKDAISDPGSAIDSISQFVTDGLGSIGSLFSFFDPKDIYQKHLTAVGLRRPHLSPFAYLPAGAKGLDSKEFSALVDLPLDQYAASLLNFSTFDVPTLIDVTAERKAFMDEAASFSSSKSTPSSSSRPPCLRVDEPPVIINSRRN